MYGVHARILVYEISHMTHMWVELYTYEIIYYILAQSVSDLLFYQHFSIIAVRDIVNFDL